MGGDGDDNQSPQPNNGKGKGRDIGEADTGARIDRMGGLLTSVMQNARSSVTASNLASTATANGKSTSSLPNIRQTSDQANDAQHFPIARKEANTARLPSAKSKAQTNASTARGVDHAYRSFENGDRVTLAQSSSPAVIGPYSSREILDAALHRQVQAELSQWNDMNSIWTEPWQSISASQSAVSSNRLRTTFPANQSFQESSSDVQRGEHIDGLLQTVDLSDGNIVLSRDGPVPNAGSNDIFALLEDEGQGVASAPEQADADFDDEQRSMHRDLNALQNSEDRADEKVRPPDDDPIARTGVYAATPEEALKAIWDGTAEGERASATIRQNTSQDESLPSRIREILKRGSYVDDVYGLPPQLMKTIVAAEEIETEENKDRKAKAIQRLEALYRHLGAAPSTSHLSIDDYIRQW